VLVASWDNIEDNFQKNCRSKASEPLQLVHSNIYGPLPIKSFYRSKYFMTFTNDYSQMTWVYSLKKKNEALKVMKKFNNLVEIEIGFKLKALLIDHKGEFLSLEPSHISIMGSTLFDN
jgi:hypothetical protein